VLPLAGSSFQPGRFRVPANADREHRRIARRRRPTREASPPRRPPFADRFVRFAHPDPAKLDQAERAFQRRGSDMVLAGRVPPRLRSLVAIPLRTPRGRYVVLTLIGSTV
jgi:hypothetical protein